MQFFYLRLHRGCSHRIASLLVFALCFLGFNQLAAQTVVAAVEEPDGIVEKTVPELIDQLGDPRYAQRAFAERALRRKGFSAFDELLAATESIDPEISASSQRILSEVTKIWHRDRDSELIRRQLIRYANRSQAERLRQIELLNRIPKAEGVEALCRLARFETSAQNSKLAAAVLLQNSAKPDYPLPASHLEAIRLGLKEIAKMDQGNKVNLDRPSRTAVRWLYEIIDENRSPQFWLDAYEKEIQLAEQNSSETSSQIAERLLWTALDCAIANADESLLSDLIDRLVFLEKNEATSSLMKISKRLILAEYWDVLMRVFDNYTEPLDNRRGLYLRARVALKRGENGAAEKFAQQALATLPNGNTTELATGKNTEYRRRALLLGERFLVAEALEKEGHREWACRELEAASQTLDPLSVSNAYARWKLGELRHDSQSYELAAAALAELEELVNSSNEMRRHYGKLSQEASWLPLPARETLMSQRWLYEALANLQQGDVDQAEESLEKSFNADSRNADVIIAMYRLEDRSLEYMTKIRERILDSCRRIELDIVNEPGSPIPYNHWAWLVSNTEGDYAKAVRYSQRSLELSPNNPGYLDTLGRCFYSVGRIEEAIQSQQLAVDQMPYVQVMRRQLELFQSSSVR